MASTSAVNQELWRLLGEVYKDQEVCVARTLARLESVAETLAQSPDMQADSDAMDELNAALERQRGFQRFAESQMVLVAVMNGYWDQQVSDPLPALESRVAEVHPELEAEKTVQPSDAPAPARSPEARRAIKTRAAPTVPSAAMAVNVAE